MAPVRLRKAPTRPPDGFLLANMRPQGASRSPPSDTRVACAFLAPRGRLSKARPKAQMVFFYSSFVVLFELQTKHSSSDTEPYTFNLWILQWFYKHIQVSMKFQKAPTRPPDGSQMVDMRPQDAPKSPPGDTREACAFWARRGWKSSTALLGRLEQHSFGCVLWIHDPTAPGHATCVINAM